MGSFKTEADVKAFLENLFTEYKFGCYGEKSAEACHLLGDYYEAVKKDHAEAIKLYQNNCDNLKYSKSCAKYGNYKLLGRACEANTNEAYKYIKQGCELGDGPACTAAGIIAVHGKEITVDDKKAETLKGVKMLQTACLEKDQEKACFFLAGVYISGIEGVMDKNLPEALKISKKACASGNPHACANVAQMYARGEGVEKNAELAKTYKDQAREMYRDLKYGKGKVDFQRGT